MVDSQLMERFVSGRDSRAFRDLVDRHGPAVLRVCRRMVHDLHEAEDAMQATFLILVQRAPTIRDPEQLDRWLAGVARRVATRARRRMAQRTERERRWAVSHAEERPASEQPIQIELRRVVREELGRMPEADRQPLTLCYLDGLTHEEAASRIGCPVGTIKARLVRARRRLRDRLDRRGVALGLGLLLFLLRRPPAASASDDLSATTAELMEWVARGDLEAVEARAPAAWNLARLIPLGNGLATPSVFVAVVVGFILMLGGIGAVAAGTSARREQQRFASERLLQLLDVNCRATP